MLSFALVMKKSTLTDALPLHSKLDRTLKAGYYASSELL
jgi:hypothetical protein